MKMGRNSNPGAQPPQQGFMDCDLAAAVLKNPVGKPSNLVGEALQHKHTCTEENCPTKTGGKKEKKKEGKEAKGLDRDGDGDFDLADIAEYWREVIYYPLASLLHGIWRGGEWLVDRGSDAVGHAAKKGRKIKRGKQNPPDPGTPDPNNPGGP